MEKRPLTILLSAPRGFCAGVDRAIQIVEKAIEKYRVEGLLPKITLVSFQLYCRLMNTIRNLGYKHSEWENSPAQAMLQHHGQALAKLRANCTTKKHFIYRTYIYLRNQSDKKFYNEGLTWKLWGKFMDVNSNRVPPPGRAAGAGGRVAGGGNEAAVSNRCPHCRGREVHV